MEDYAEIFSENLKKLRKEQGITQRVLGNMFGYSEKAVSKWEGGQSIPSIGVLLQLAQLFNTSIDALFQATVDQYFLGIDAGGVASEFLLTDINGKTVNFSSEKGCNPNDIGLEAAKKILLNGIHEVCKGVPLSKVVVFAGISGGRMSDYSEDFKSFLQNLGFLKVYNGSDVDNVIAVGLGEDDGVAVVLGTGIAAFRQMNGEISCTAGWGHLFDQGGSNYNLGHDALEAAMLQMDGRGKNTLLYDMILQKSGRNLNNLVPLLYSKGRQYIASFSPLVFEAADQGDAVALEIIQRNFSVVEEIIRAAAKPLGRQGITVALGGGLAKNRYLLEVLSDKLREPDFCLKTVTSPPVFGAVKNAMRYYFHEVEHDK